MVKAFVHESAPLLTGEATAVFSEDRQYRYRLTRTWGSSGTHATWIMLNPSTADALEDDPTIRRCIGFTRQWGLDGLIVVNLFALRATDPAELLRARAPIGDANDQFIREAVHPWSVVVAAWGAHPLAAVRSQQVLEMITAKADVGCLGTTKGGYPRHPLYIAADTPLEPCAA